MYGIPATPAPVVDGMSRGGAAEIAGMQVGDRIVSFNGSENPKWETIRGDGLLSPGQLCQSSLSAMASASADNHSHCSR